MVLDNTPDSTDKNKPIKASKDLPSTAYENQVGAGLTTPKTGQELTPEHLDLTPIVPEEKLTDMVVGAMVPAGGSAVEAVAPETHPQDQEPSKRKVHPFTYMSNDAAELARQAKQLQKDIGDPTERQLDEKRYQTDLSHLKTEIDEVQYRHLKDDPNYQKDWHTTDGELSRAFSALYNLDHAAQGSSTEQKDLSQLTKDEETLQKGLAKLYTPALHHGGSDGGGSGAGGSGGDGGGGSDSGKLTGSDNMILGIQNLKGLEEADASGMKFGSVRLWDDGVKINQLMNKDGSINPTAWKALEEYTQTAHGMGKGVMYTFGETRDKNGDCLPPTDAQIRAVTEQLTKWSAQQKAEGKGGIDTYELWNEPNYKGFWTGSPQELAHINGIMAQIIRQNDPTAKIAAPAVSFWSKNTASWEEQYLQAYKQEWGLNSQTFDQIDFHGYGFPGQAPEQIQNDIDQMKQVEAQFGLQGKPLVDSEDSFGKDTEMPNTQEQADYLARKAVLEEFDGVTPGWYAIGNQDWGGMDKPNQLTAAETAIYNWMDGATLEKLNHSGDIYTASLLRDGKQEEIAWTTGNQTQFDPGSQYSSYQTLSGGTGSVDGSFDLSGSPVLLE